MRLPLPVERRHQPRRRVFGFLPGQLELEGTGERVVCRPLDVSQKGMAIFCEDHYGKEAQFRLRVGDTVIHFEVMYVKESPGDAVGYRIGLQLTSPDIDLQEFFSDIVGES